VLETGGIGSPTSEIIGNVASGMAFPRPFHVLPRKVREFEKQNKDRETLVGQIDRKIRANA
jgi:hypothetical protein